MVRIRQKHQKTEEEIAQEKREKEQKSLGIQDEFQARGFELVAWTQQHRGPILAFIGLLVVGGLAYSGYLYYLKRLNEEASQVYIQAVKELETPAEKTEKPEDEKAKREKALQAFSQLEAQFGRSKVSELGMLYASFLELQNDKPAEAASSYQRALQSLSKTSELRPLALTGLGYGLETKGDLEQARQSFQEILDMNVGLAEDLALWKVAELSQSLKDFDRAKKNAQDLVERFPTSPYYRKAQVLLAALSK